MNTRPHLHYHTDCDFFAGCENMIANFLNDERTHRNFKVSFSYRKSERYETGFKNRVSAWVGGESYPILAGNILNQLAVNMPGYLHIAIRGLNYLLLLRYWILAWNVLVLYRAWRHRGIDLLHINNGGYPGAVSCQSAAIAASLAGISRVVMVVNNIATPSRYWFRLIDWPLNRLIARSVTIFVTGSRFAGQALQATLHCAPDKFASIHNGIKLRTTGETRAETRDRLCLPKDTLVFGIVALLEHRKGHCVLLNAMAVLRQIIGDKNMPILLIEGEGPELCALERAVEELAVGHWVRFVGTERNVFDFMQALDVIVLPSIANEDFPNVVLEAMGLGKPVIASRIAGTSEQIEDGITGWLVEPGDSSALALKMSTFIEDNEQISAVGARARTQFEERFTADVAVSRYLNLYQALLNRSEN
jgi:glycosyltransferase involved in cell wall biosynthesis